MSLDDDFQIKYKKELNNIKADLITNYGERPNPNDIIKFLIGGLASIMVLVRMNSEEIKVLSEKDKYS